MLRLACCVSFLVSALSVCLVPAAESRFAETGSRSQYVHWIDLYDANSRKIDPSSESAAPYSPEKTCGRCHDYEAMTHGYHFGAIRKLGDSGRPGEPWIWSDERTATQIPLSYRDWPGTYDPETIGISPWSLVQKFGRHMPGGGPGQWPSLQEELAKAQADAAKAAGADAERAAESEGEDAAAEDEVPNRWPLAGELQIDCMICHSNNHAYSMEVWQEQIDDENFAWAPTAASGLGYVDGKVSGLPDDFNPAEVEEGSRNKLPTIKYAPDRVNDDNRVFFDVIRKPSNNACYYCHTTRVAGDQATPEWNHDEDVHVRAGMACADCHRNGIGHHTVRGFDGEQHPTGQPVASLSCRGCHMGEDDAGRMGAPLPAHKGLPPLHFDKLSCTACHSGPRLTDQADPVMTALAHGLGLPSHDYSADMPPGIVAPVLLPDDGKLYPHRMTWPALWGYLQTDQITPLDPELTYDTLRKIIRRRSGQTWPEALKIEVEDEERVKLLGEERAEVDEEELTEDERSKLDDVIQEETRKAFLGKLAEALEALQEVIPAGATPVYVGGGKAYRLGDGGEAEAFEHEAAAAYAWRFGHDVRPARDSLGITGCFECHASGTPIFESQVTTVSPIPEEAPTTQAMYQLAGFDKFRLDAWNQSFQGRTAFKFLGFASMGIVSLMLLAYAMRGLSGLAKVFRRNGS